MYKCSTSGVGGQARFLINGLINTGKYSFRCYGAAVQHESMDVTKINDDFIIRPTNGFGTPDLLRVTLATEKPDAVLLFTDPRFFIWLWEMEDEVHQVCPITYWHLWDELPAPTFNKSLYESTDLVNCINYPTYKFVKEWFPEKTNYIPHAVPQDLYKPLSKIERSLYRKQIAGKDDDEFIALWVGRNARRKMPGDILVSWRLFLDKLQAKYGHQKASLIMHTDPLDQEGPNLYHQIEALNLKNKIIFSKDRIDFNQMNMLYNVCDVGINRSTNEGFGLPMLETMMAGKPIIAVKTGGLTRQVENYHDGSQNGVALEPDLMSLVGSQMVPYIYEAHVTHESYANALMKMYELGPDEREKLGLKAREYALQEYNLSNVVKQWDESLEYTINNWKKNYKKVSCITL